MKRGFIFFAAFALLALLTPVGAKGQETQQQTQEPDRSHLSVAFARNLANLDWPVVMYGYVNYAWEQYGGGAGNFYLQDNNSVSDGRGIMVNWAESILSAPLNDEIRVGSYVKVTATKVVANNPAIPTSAGAVIINTVDCTSIEVISQDNELMVVNASLQGLKAAHFPLATHLVSDAYQHRLVKLTNLKVVDEITNYNGIKSYVVQDATLARDTLYYPYLQLEVGQSIASMVVVNTRRSYEKLLLRSLDDLTIEHSLFQARHLAGANMPVSFTGTVTFRTDSGTNPATVYMQATDASNNTTGIALFVHNCPSSVQAGSIIAVSANKVCFDEERKSVFISSTDITDLTVVGQDPIPRVRNMSLEGMKNTHYPATPQRVMNDIYQHTLVKVFNVTVVELLENNWFRGCVVENADHTRDTISYYYSDSEPTLQVGQTLASVIAVNCRESGTAYGGMMKLCLRSVDDIDFNIKSIRYARTHIDQTHVVEGVVSFVNANEVYIQDNTGGLYISGPDFPDLAVGDRIRVQVHPEINYISIKCFDSHVIAVLGHDETLNPMVPDNIATLYQLDPNNPGPSFYEERKMKLQNTVVKSKTYYYNERLYIEVYQSGGDPNQTVMLYCYVPLFTANELDDLNSRINAGTLVPSATGVKTTAISTHYLTGITNIQIVEPHFISLSTYPSQLSAGTGMSVTLRADEYYSWELENQGATPGTRIYLHANHSVPNDYNMIDRYLNPLNAPYTGQCPNMELLRIDCTTHPDLQLTRVNENCWSFIMPNEDVAFEGVYWPKKENGSLCEFSDVWEAREGATESLETAPLAYLRAIVTDVDEGWYRIQDAYNHNCNNDELKKYNGILVHASSDGLQVGDNVYLCGYPNLYEWYEGTVVLSDVRVLRKGNYGYIEHAYPTTLAGIVEDYYGSGHSSAKDSRLQDRVVSLSDVYVQMVSEGYIYINQTIGDETKSAVVTLPENATITEGSTISQMTVINMTDRQEEEYGDAELILRSMDDMPGANEITLGTNRVEFNEFGGTVSVPLTIGANLGGTPELITDSYNLNFTATMNANHTAIDITVPASNSTENGIGSIQVTVGEISSELLAVVQTGCAPAAFDLWPSNPVYPFDDHAQHSLQVRNVAHVQEPYSSHISAELVEFDNMGTDWITLGSWNEASRSFSFTLSDDDYTGSNPRGVKIAVTMTGTDGTGVTKESTIWQNPPAAAMTVSPSEWETGPLPKCVPVTQTFTVFYENAFDQMSYNADYIWLDWNFGYDIIDFYDFNQDFSVEPEYIPVDESGFGAATFTVTYTPNHERIQDGSIWARIGEYDIVNHEGIPGGAASPQVWVWPTVYDPFFGWTKVNNADELMSANSILIVNENATMEMGDLDYSGHAYGYYYGEDEMGTNLIDFMWNEYTNSYTLRKNGNYISWTQWDGLHENWDEFEQSNYWNITFDASGNAVISNYTNNNYHIVWNGSESYFECVESGGLPVQIYRLMDGSIPKPTVSAPSEWFKDGQTLDVTLTPAEGTSFMFWYSDYIGNYDGGSITEPFTFTAVETTYVGGYSYTCDNSSELVNKYYYKVNDIDDVRDDADGGSNYSIKGIVTYSDNDMLFVQDETGGIHATKDYISDWIVTGEEVILTGSPETQNNGQWTTFANATYNLTLSEGNTVEPVLTTFSELNNNPAQYQAQLVKVEGVTVGYHDEVQGYYYLSDDGGQMYLRDTYEGGFPFVLEYGSYIDLTAVFVKHLYPSSGIGLLIRDDDEDIIFKNPCNATAQVYSDEALSTPNASWNSHVYFCDADYNPVNTNSFIPGDLVYLAIEDGYSVGLNEEGLPVVAVCNATTGETIYDSYTNYMVWPYDNNRHFAFLMPQTDATVKVWLMEGTIGDQCNVIFNLVDSWGDGWNDNYLVVTGNGVSQQLTIESGNSSATYVLPFATGTHVSLSWVYGNFSNECSFTVMYENGAIIYELSDPEGTDLYAFDVDCNTAPPTFTVTATTNPTAGGSVSGSGTYEYGTTCTLEATPAAGYTFLYWEVDDEIVSTSATYFFTVTEDVNFVAHFGEESAGCVVVFDLVDSYGDGWNGNALLVTDSNVISQELTIESGFSAVYVLQYPSGTHLMLNWVAGSFANECSFTVSYNDGTLIYEGTELSEGFSYEFDVNCGEPTPTEYTITAIANPVNGGTVTGAGTYAEGETCTLVATASTGYEFLYWTVDGVLVSFEETFVFSVTESVDYVANFSENIYIITATANPVNGGTVSGAGTYTYGATATLTATANEGYTFLNWTKSGTVVSTNATYTFTVTESADLVANFEEDQVITYTIAATANPTAGGNVFGAGTYAEGETCTLTARANAGYTFINWMNVTGAVVSTNSTYSFTVTEDADFVANFEEDEPGGDITQTSNLSAGWNWWSAYVELGNDGLTQLQSGLGTSGEMIKSQNNGYASYLAGFGWYGSLTAINNQSTYQVKANAACTVELTGNATDPADYPITLNSGWSWVGYPVAVSMSVIEALSGIEPMTGDMLKSQNNGYASYLAGFGWYGSLNTLQPGMGLMYKSNNGSAVTLVYPNNGTRNDLKANQTADNNHWRPNLNAYPDNMSVMAVVELDGNELEGENFELAAFANGTVRGSARLLYVEPLNRYMAFLTVAGEDAAELRFGLYNAETGEECIDSDNVITYVTNAVVGSFAEPYVVSFRGTTGTNEWANNLNVFPNPVERGQKVSLGFNDIETDEVQVEIINALGAIVETRRAAPLQTITAPETAGVYTLRITVEGKGTCYRKLVVR